MLYRGSPFLSKRHLSRAAVAASLVGGIAYISLATIGAATFVASSEAESGAIAGAATATADQSASGGSAIRFGAPGGGGGTGCQSLPKIGGGTWQCTFSDEFNGTSLDRNIWGVIPYGLGSSCQSDDAQHVQVAGGDLRLIATRNSTSDYCYTQYGLEYTGGFIQTQGNFAQRYGRFEIRAKLPQGNGFWPAFWMLPGDDSYDGEIDILEAYGGRVEQGGDVGDFTLHVPAAGPGPQKTCRILPNYHGDYHTYTFEWKAGNMKAYYDGLLCADFSGVSDNGTSPPAFPATFDKPYHILLNLAVQPWWPPNSNTVFPGVMLVDYVRVWQ